MSVEGSGEPTSRRFRCDLARWAQEAVGPEAEVDAVRPMPGNAGQSYGFDVHPEPGARTENYVIRLAPAGVERRGSTDVLRQVPLLGALSRTPVPIAPVRWWTDDPGWFGTDVLIQSRLAARPLHMSEAGQSAQQDTGDVLPYLRQAIDVLAAVHAVNWRDELPEWSEVRGAAKEIDFWARLAARTAPLEWARRDRDLVQLLHDRQPSEDRIGLVHGDFQTNNVLFDEEGRLCAVIDWELAGIGPTGLDLGWLIMMTDPACWSDDYRAQLRVHADPAWIAGHYEDAAHHEVDAVLWYEALACHRFAAISSYNLRLHETGKRTDPFWELMATSIPTLLHRGAELAEMSSATVTAQPGRRGR